MSDTYEEMRRKELELQEKQLFAQRVTAAAAVANAAATAQQAATVEQMRRQMAFAAEREAEHQREMAAQQAKELSESVPVIILDSVSPQEAQRAIATLEMAGAKTELS